MKYIEALEAWRRKGDERGLFLAGGITGCPDWQEEMVVRLTETDLVLLNPRRKSFPIDDPLASLAQITWEFDHLRAADAISFWFPCETLCPIVLYELGAWTRTVKPIFVGVHPEYRRRQDVEIQVNLVRPKVKVVHSLVELAAQVKRGMNRLSAEVDSE